MQEGSEIPQANSRFQGLIPFMLMAVATIGLLFAVQVFQVLPCWAIFPLTAIIAWPVWHAQREHWLFTRRLVLRGATLEQSRVRGWFWQGKAGSALLLAAIIPLVVLTLASGVLLQPEHWLLLFADALVLALLYAYFKRRLVGQSPPEAINLLARGQHMRLINIGLIALLFFLADFFWVGVPDTRDQAWAQILEAGFQEYRQAMSCEGAGLLTGALAALDQVTWHFAQQEIPALPDAGTRLLFWILFLVRFGVVAIIFTNLLIGTLILAERSSAHPQALMDNNGTTITFFLTILILAIPFLFASLKIEQARQQDLPYPDSQHPDAAGPARQASEPLDPCRPDSTLLARKRTQLDADLRRAMDASSEIARLKIDAQVEALYAPLVGGVDHYLDWYFTVIGEYERLGTVLMGENFQDYMKQKLDEYVFAQTNFRSRFDGVEQGVLQDASNRMTAIAQDLKGQIGQWVKKDPCGMGTLDLSSFHDLDRDALRVGISATTGAATAITAVIVAKIMAKKTLQVAAAMATKFAVKKTGSVLVATATGTAVCSPGGPIAIACGIGLGLATWFGVDKLFIEADEALNRDEMRAEILQVLDEEKAKTKEKLAELHQATMTRMATTTGKALDGVFLPARDGL